jgi:hypothetical protein
MNAAAAESAARGRIDRWGHDLLCTTMATVAHLGVSAVVDHSTPCPFISAVAHPELRHQIKGWRGPANLVIQIACSGDARGGRLC